MTCFGAILSLCFQTSFLSSLMTSTKLRSYQISTTELYLYQCVTVSVVRRVNCEMWSPNQKTSPDLKFNFTFQSAVSCDKEPYKLTRFLIGKQTIQSALRRFRLRVLAQQPASTSKFGSSHSVVVRDFILLRYFCASLRTRFPTFRKNSAFISRI